MKKNLSYRTPTAVTLLLAVSSLSHASVLALYEFDDATVNATETDDSSLFAASFVDASLTASTFSGLNNGSSFTAALVLSTTDTIFISEGTGLADGTDNNIGGAIAANQFFSFSVSSAVAFDLTSLSFDIFRGGNGANDYSVRSSIDNFGTDIVTGTSDGFVDQAISQTSSEQTIALSGGSFDSLSTIEFRIFLDDRQGNGTNASSVSIDNVTLNGAVLPIPEPSSAVILLGGISVLMLVRRRK